MVFVSAPDVEIAQTILLGRTFLLKVLDVDDRDFLSIPHLLHAADVSPTTVSRGGPSPRRDSGSDGTPHHRRTMCEASPSKWGTGVYR